MERVFEVAGEERRCLVAETYWKSIDKRYTKCLYLKNLLSIYENITTFAMIQKHDK